MESLVCHEVKKTFVFQMLSAVADLQQHRSSHEEHPAVTFLDKPKRGHDLPPKFVVVLALVAGSHEIAFVIVFAVTIAIAVRNAM